MKLRYDECENWARLPDGLSLLEVADVATGPDGRVYAFTRGKGKMVVFDQDGNFIESWGHDIFSRPHGVTVSYDGTLWCVDDGDHTIRRCTTAGQVLQTIGIKGQPAPLCSGLPFNRPTKVAEEPGTHNLYISDGYGNAKVHKYSPDGQHLFSWGDFGKGKGEFNLVHMTAVDPQGLVYVADRENHRVQIFDSQGNFLKEWSNDIHRPCGIFISSEPLVYITQLGPALSVTKPYPNLGLRVSIHDLDGRQLTFIGELKGGLGKNQFIAPHSVAVDSKGDVYVGEVSWSDYGQHLAPPREVRSFRKFVRI